MVQIIGMMIGLYIMARMASLVTRSGDRKEALVVRIICGLVLAADILLMFALFTSGSPSPPNL